MNGPTTQLSFQIRAPYNFVPLSACIISPEWRHAVSQDLPLADGLSGVLHFELRNHTPLLVGGVQGKDSEERTEVRPFQLPNGEYAIPGSSLRGMLRNVLEIAAFGKMGRVQDKPLGIRDISGKYVKEVYHKALYGADAQNPTLPMAGFVRRRSDGGAELIPCEYKKVSHIDLEQALEKAGVHWKQILGGQPYLFIRNDSVVTKYNHWKQVTTSTPFANQIDGLPALPYRLDNISFPAGTSRPIAGAKPDASSPNSGILVFTSQISDRKTSRPMGKRITQGKYKDYVFFNEKINHAKPIPDEIWRAFRFIHGDGEAHKGETKGPWLEFWKERFLKGQRVPVFYRLGSNGHPKILGLAYLIKLAYDYTIGETVAHTGTGHQASQEQDLPELLFGAINGEKEEAGLKGRVSVGLARQAGKKSQPVPQPPTILNTPKPTYFPNYILQKGDNGQIQGETYQTYMARDGEVRGWKRYPVRMQARVQPLTSEQVANKKVQAALHPLPAGLVFKGSVRFHNLLPVELGALLWAMTWGGDSGKRHALGMGKSFGYGQVGLTVSWDKTAIVPNKPGSEVEELSHYVQAFEAWIDQRYRQAQGLQMAQGWRQSEQLVQLLAMADPAQAEGHRLEHMGLAVQTRHQGGGGIANEFVHAKQQGCFLPEYVTYTGVRDRELFPRATGRTPTPATVPTPTLSPWLARTIKELMEKIRTTKQEEILRGKLLAQTWQTLPDNDEKWQALQEIDRLWTRENLWQQAKSGSIKLAAEIYRQGLQEMKERKSK